MKDIFIKDEGDFITVGFQSDKAKEVLSTDKELSKITYGNELPKIDLDSKGICEVKLWCGENQLTYEEC